ncbi:MAG: ABC transporter permease, partial [Nitrososphaerales archaeon]
MVSFKRIFSDLSIFRREYLRNRTGFFFALIFPIILILIFGAIFSGGSTGPIAVTAQNRDAGPVGALFLRAMNSTNVTQISLLPNNESLPQYLQAHSGSVGILIPQNFTSSLSPTARQPVKITIYSNPSDTSGQIVLGVTNGVVNAFNLRLNNATPVVGLQTQNVVSTSYNYIDFLIPGLIGFSILTSPMFSMVNISSEYKKSKFFKQLSLTPLTKGEWLVSKVIWYFLLSVISFVLMTTVGTLAFKA